MNMILAMCTCQGASQTEEPFELHVVVEGVLKAWSSSTLMLQVLLEGDYVNHVLSVAGLTEGKARGSALCGIADFRSHA